MSQTVLGTLRRHVGSLLSADFPERPPTDPVGSASATSVTDGGEPSERESDEHLRDIPDGAGCTEIWEYLSERQAATVEVDADD